MAKVSPTQRTLKRLREDGYICQVVEKWNAFTFTRSDLFGVIDVLAISRGDEENGGRRHLLAIQATSGGNVTARVKKVLSSPLAQAFVETGSRLECWGWRKLVNKGKRTKWEVDKRVITLASFSPK